MVNTKDDFIRGFELDIDKTKSVYDILGKKVLSSDGKKLGTVEDVRINPLDFMLESIKVGKGLFSEDYYIGKTYIKSISENSIILNVTPVKEFIGKKVFDSEGKNIGVVKEVKTYGDSNDYFSILVNRGMGKIDILIQENVIYNIGENVVMNQPFEE